MRPDLDGGTGGSFEANDEYIAALRMRGFGKLERQHAATCGDTEFARAWGGRHHGAMISASEGRADVRWPTE